MVLEVVIVLDLRLIILSKIYMQGEWTASNDYGQLWGLSIEIQCKQGFTCVQIRFK